MNSPDQFIKESDTVTAVLCDLLQVWLLQVYYFIYKSILGALLTYLCLEHR